MLRICSNHERCRRTFNGEFCPHKVPHSLCKGICPETQEPVVCETWDEIQKRFSDLVSGKQDGPDDKTAPE